MVIFGKSHVLKDQQGGRVLTWEGAGVRLQGAGCFQPRGEARGACLGSSWGDGC